MDIGKKDIITLSDNHEYGVVSIANYNNKKYYYLVDINDTYNQKICYEEENKLIEVLDDVELKSIISKLFMAVKDEIKSMLKGE